MTRWYEDITIGEPFPLGSHDFTETEIVRFGGLYDPQYFHVDPEAAKLSHFGGLVASGWHTVTVGHRHMVDALSAEDQKVVEAEFAAGFARLETSNRNDNTAAREALKQQGITFDAPSEAERRNWQAVGQDVFKQLEGEGALSRPMLDALTAALAEARGGSAE